MKDLLDRLHKAIDGLANPGGADDGTVDMNADQFVAYATEQLEAAAKDKPEIRKARIDHLKGQIESVIKNFEGPTATPGGSFAVQQFRDRDQLAPTSQERPTPGSVSTGGSNNFAQQDPPNNQQGVGNTPPGGTMPAPDSAGSSGFASPAEVTFAKRLEGMAKALVALTKGEGDDPPAGDPPADKPPAKAEGDDGEKVEKGLGVLWPLDLNTPFGRGDKDAPEEPEWGYDAGSRMAEVMKSKKGDEKPPAADSNAAK